MSEIKLTLELRTLTGKKLVELRKSGLIPSVVYGGKSEILTASAYNETEKALRAAGRHSPIKLVIDGKNKLALVKNVALNPISRMIDSVEFQAISAREAVEATAPIVVTNFEESEAAKANLAFNQLLDSVEVKAKPANLPSELTLDASKLATLEDKLTVADLQLPENVEFVKEIDGEQVIVSLFDPIAEAEARKAAEEAAAAAEAAAEAETSGEESAEAEETPAESAEPESSPEEKSE